MRARVNFVAGIMVLAVGAGSAAYAAPPTENIHRLEWIVDGDGPRKLDSLTDFLSPSTPGDAPPIEPHVRAPLSADARALVAGNNAFALDMYHRLSGNAGAGENLLVSPLSISAALGMTYAGARGRTAQQMADALHFALPDNRLHAAFGEVLRDLSADREGYKLSIANRLFGQAGYHFEQPFLDTTGRDYGAPLEPVDFKRNHEAARLRINEWVEDQTNDRIRNLLPDGSIDEHARLVLTNAIHFDGSWKYEFDKSDTRKESFYTASEESQVDMMRQSQRFPYAELPGFRMLEMPYAGDDLSLVALLPNERDGLASLEASLTPEMLESSLAALYETQVNVTLPKFKFDSKFKLGDPLWEMGMTDAFDPNRADLTGIAMPDDGKLVISNVLHKTFIDVNEEGTEAAAATAVVVAIATSAFFPPQPKEFRADHPFLFALRDRHSGSLLFLGRVTDPGALAASAAATVPEPGVLTLVLILVVVAPLRKAVRRA